MMGVLRESAAGQHGIEAPAPGLEDLGALISDVGQSGVIVDLRIDGHALIFRFIADVMLERRSDSRRL